MRSEDVSMKGWVWRGSAWRGCSAEKERIECRGATVGARVCQSCGGALVEVPEELEAANRSGTEIEIEVEVTGTYRPAERRTRWEPGCGACVEDVRAWVRLPDGREVEFPLTAQERADFESELIEKIEVREVA